MFLEENHQEQNNNKLVAYKAVSDLDTLYCHKAMRQEENTLDMKIPVGIGLKNAGEMQEIMFLEIHHRIIPRQWQGEQVWNQFLVNKLVNQ